jgi:anti-anti-sigma regulatory factor/HAMP domain-containing protein
MFTRLRNRLTVIFIFLATAPLIAVAAILAVRTYDQLVSDAIQSQRTKIERFQIAIQDMINQHVDELALMDKMYGFEQQSVQQQRDLMNSLLVQRDAYGQIIVMNPNGTERLHVSRFGAVVGTYDHSSESVFQDVISTREIRFSDVHFHEQSGEPLLTIGVPFFDLRSGAISSVMLVDFRFKLVWDLVAELASSDEGDTDVFMTIPSGLVVAHQNPSIALKGTVFAIPEKDGRSEGLDGEAAIVTTRSSTLGNIQFVFVAQESLTAALRPAYEMLGSIVLVTVIALAVSIVLVVMVVRQIVSPIERLTKTAQAIREGELSAKATVDRQDELGDLAESFNAMTAQLRQTFVELEQNEARVRNIIERLPIGMHIFHLEPDGKLLFDGANPAGGAIIGEETNNLVGRPIEEAFPVLVSTELPARYREAANAGAIWQAEEIHFDGERLRGDYAVYAFQTSPGNMVSAWIDVGERKQAEEERARLQQQVIDAQKQAIRDLSSPVIPVLDTIIVMPLIGSIDTARARDITRALLTGITDHEARVAIIDITGVPIVDSGVADHLNKTIQAARLKGTHTIVTGISGPVAEAIIDLGIDWSDIETVRDLQTGLISALRKTGTRLGI